MTIIDFFIMCLSALIWFCAVNYVLKLLFNIDLYKTDDDDKYNKKSYAKQYYDIYQKIKWTEFDEDYNWRYK